MIGVGLPTSPHTAQMGNEMSKYEPRFTNYYISTGAVASVCALIVRIDRDGQESVIHSYRARHFRTRAAAEKSTAAYIAKINAA